MQQKSISRLISTLLIKWNEPYRGIIKCFLIVSRVRVLERWCNKIRFHSLRFSKISYVWKRERTRGKERKVLEWTLLSHCGRRWVGKKSRGKIRHYVVGTAVESHPVNYRGGGRQIIARPTANPIIAGLMVSPVARATASEQLTQASQSAGLYQERNIPEHPRIVEAIIWSNARRALRRAEWFTKMRDRCAIVEDSWHAVARCHAASEVAR